MIFIYVPFEEPPAIKDGYSRLFQCPEMVLGVVESNGEKYTMDAYGYHSSRKFPEDSFKQPLGDFPTGDHSTFQYVLRAHGISF